MNQRIEKRIAEVSNEIASLEAKQAFHRRVIAPQAAALVAEWRNSLKFAEDSFKGVIRGRVEGNRSPTLDLSAPGAEAFFFRELIEARLTELAFHAIGRQAVREHDRCGEEYAPVDHALAALRAELESLRNPVAQSA